MAKCQFPNCRSGNRSPVDRYTLICDDARQTVQLCGVHSRPYVALCDALRKADVLTGKVTRGVVTDPVGLEYL